MLDATDRALIARVSGDIGDGRYPYRDLGAELNLPEEDVLARLRAYRARGLCRRFGAILRHQLAGFAANGMSVWDVPEGEVAHVGLLIAAHAEVTHCYERPRLPDWPYNVYAMLHGKARDECEAIAAGISRETGVAAYQVLFSLRELKKTSMRYFPPGATAPAEERAPDAGGGMHQTGP